ncbi:site-specific DNA-methyltransferase [Armatimonas sp.]|uniref:site-specific DNA-methyltransferase n=1 Tax=Armatimonas sp. TaxID=1872638 RepID=UPI0037528557
MTELIWDGKYTQDAKSGKRIKTPPVRVSLPFQTIETVNESTEDRSRTASLFATGRESEWRNRLIWGDKKYVLPSLLPEFAGKVDLIYIDPPFDTGANFSFTRTIPDSEETFTKEPSVIEQKAYRDTWGKGLDSYLKWFYETAVLLRELLSETGSIFVHLDDNIGHYAKCILDEVFGIDRYLNEIIWQRTDAHNDAKGKFGNIHDVIFWYAKTSKNKYNYNDVRVNLSSAALNEYSLLKLPDGTIINYSGNEDKVGRRFKLDDATWKGTSNKKKFIWRGASPSDKREWMYDFEGMEKALVLGDLYLRNPEKGAARCKVSYLDDNLGMLLQDIWTDTARMKGGSIYATQKPEELLERIIKSASDEEDLVLDCFCGSGTTAATAERLGRRWITCDLGRFAIHTARKRLLGIEAVKPFVVQNLGKYERQQWQVAEFGNKDKAAAIETAYRKFLLELFKARQLESGTWLHGIKNGRMVHIGGVDAPVSTGDITQIAIEFKKRMGTGEDAPKETGVDILGWDFAFEVNEVGKQTVAEAGIQARFYKIPREVLEKKAVEQGDIKFFELAALSVDKTQTGKSVTIELTDFVIPTDDVPDDVQRAIKHWAQWVDYWAVDWDFKGDTFHNQWQTYRSKKNPELQKRVAYSYAEPGTYVILIKVIDILGNDTTKTLHVTVT